MKAIRQRSNLLGCFMVDWWCGITHIALPCDLRQAALQHLPLFRQPRAEAAVVNVNNVPPAEGKNGLNTLCLQGTGHQMAPTNLGYNIALVGMSLDSEYSRMALRLLRFCPKSKWADGRGECRLR